MRHTKNSDEVRQQPAGGHSGAFFASGVGQSVPFPAGPVPELHVSIVDPKEIISFLY